MKLTRFLLLWFLAGTLVGVSMSPPFYFFPAGFVFAVAWVSAKSQVTFLRGAFTLAIMLYGYFCSTFSWFAAPMTIDKSHWSLIPFAILGSGLVFSCIAMLIFAPILLFVKKSTSKNGEEINPFIQTMLLSIGWCAFEEFRSRWLFGGLPWQTIGTIFTISPYTLYLAKYIGRIGLDALASLVVFAPIYAIPKTIPFNTKRLKQFVLGFFAFILIILIGGLIIIPPKKALFKKESNKLITLLGIQGNIDRKISYLSGSSLSHRAMSFRKYIGISKVKTMQIKNNPFVLIWPEGALSFYHKGVASAIYNNAVLALGDQKKPQLLNDISNQNNEPSNAVNGIIIFPSIIIEGETLKTQLLYNAVTVINSKGQPFAIYKKRHPVPFGEYLPLRGLMPKGLEEIIGLGDILPSDEPLKHIVYNGIRMAPIICFDIIFDDDWRDQGIKPDIAINVSNDAWLGSSLGFYQHFAQVKMRSVIADTPVLRVANNGITAYLDQWGRTIVKIPPNEVDSIRINMPI